MHSKKVWNVPHSVLGSLQLVCRNADAGWLGRDVGVLAHHCRTLAWMLDRTAGVQDVFNLGLLINVVRIGLSMQRRERQSGFLIVELCSP